MSSIQTRIQEYKQRKHDKRVGSIGNGIWLDANFHEHIVGYTPETITSEGVLPSFYEEFSS